MKYIIRNLSSTNIIFFLFVIYLLIPSIYIHFIPYNQGTYGYIQPDIYYEATKWNLISTVIFIFTYTITVLIFNFKKNNKNISLSDDNYINMHKSISHILFLGYLSAFIIIIGFVEGGYTKITSLGSTNIDSYDYRTLGWDEGSRFLSLALQIARRLFLPFAVLYLAVCRKIVVNKYRFHFYLLLFFLLLGSLMTLDRAPILLVIVMYFFYKYSFERSNKKIFYTLFLLIFILIIVTGVLTFLQYNKTDFSRSDVTETGLNFLLNRAYMTPTVLSVELSFSLFPYGSDKLFLSYSRLGFLVGREYIGTSMSTSVYVAPVNIVGDIWRNFGLLGMILFGFLNGLYFSIIDRILRNKNPILVIPITYTLITLGFYFIFGGFFSLGILTQMLFIPLMLKLK